MPACLAGTSSSSVWGGRRAGGRRIIPADPLTPPPPARPPAPPRPPRRLFTFTRASNKSLGGGDLAMLASNCVLSALAIPPYEQAVRHDADPAAATERAHKMASILGFNVVRAWAGLGWASWPRGAAQ